MHVHLRGSCRPKSHAILAHAARTYLLFAALAILALQHARLSRARLCEGWLQQELATQAARSEDERFRLARAIDEVEASTAQLATCQAQRPVLEEALEASVPVPEGLPVAEVQELPMLSSLADVVFSHQLGQGATGKDFAMMLSNRREESLGQEARLLAQLNHPGIVKVHYIVNVQDRVTGRPPLDFIMDFAGPSIADAKDKLDTAQAVASVFYSVSQALRYRGRHCSS